MTLMTLRIFASLVLDEPVDTLQHLLKYIPRVLLPLPPAAGRGELASPHLDELHLEAPRGPALDHLGQAQPVQEVPQVVDQREQSQQTS